MKSINFEFLRAQWPELSSLGGFAEQYAWPDPTGCLVKLRTYIESMISRFYDEFGLQKPLPASINEMLNEPNFKQAVPSVVLNAFHSVRLAGNKASHGESIKRFNVMDLLHDAYNLGRWFFIINGGKKDECPNYRVPERKISPDETIEAIKRIAEKFSSKRRKALLVQATGTGKTRVAIALTDLLNRASWVKRVLFLCDRKELRKQAKNAFNEYMSEGITIVSSGTAKERDKRIYLATYPAMNKIFQTFDVGFFDLIIADESHRSIYNRYLDMFRYFDCLQVGLTATPVDFISRNTFKMFDCEVKTPTAYYSLDQAVDERYLVPYDAYTHTTQFLREGIKYKDLSEEQKRQLEEDGEDPADFEYENHKVDKQIFNRDTNRTIIRNLMENGIRDKTGQFPGKTIIDELIEIIASFHPTAQSPGETKP